MLTPKPQYDLKTAKEYYSNHLTVGDYYSQNEQVGGEWIGLGAEHLGLTGKVTEEAFHRLCENRFPDAGGKQLTPHQKKNRRIFYDYVISPPKSVSLVAVMLDDQRIVEAHNRAVDVMMKAYETFAYVRDHKNGMRRTGNIVGARFRHETSRDLDPFLHTHCLVFNATFDEERERWMAYENHGMYRAQKFAENLYYHELSRHLKSFGYGIVNHARGDFEIEGISRELIELFSKRRESIVKSVDELLAENPEMVRLNEGEIRKKAAVWNRPQKAEDQDTDVLRKNWKDELSGEQLEELRRVQRRAEESPSRDSNPITASQSLTWAEEHLFSRKAVVEEQELWRYALTYGRGHDFSFDDLKQQMRSRDDFLREHDRPWLLTTKQALEEEDKIIAMVNSGLSSYDAFVPEADLSDTTLDEEQQKAAEEILDSRGFLTVFRGGAGTGKSYTLRGVRDSLLKAGKTLCVLTPQNQQAMELEEEGLSGAQTVSKILTTRSLPEKTVVILDEAGQLDRVQMLDLMALVYSVDGRLICSGDTRQHGAVGASDALVAIEKYSSLKTINLKKIRRQNPKDGRTAEEKEFIRHYLGAVKLASEKKITQSYEVLDTLGTIVEASPVETASLLAADYLKLTTQGDSVVVVSQTWSMIHQLNASIRASLRDSGQLKGKDYHVESLQPRDLSNAKKRDERYYDEDSIIVFNQACMGFKKGERATLLAVAGDGLIVEGKRLVKPIHFKHLDKLTVSRPREIPVAKGDRLQLKANGTSVEGRKLANGEVVTVKRINDKGLIYLDDGRVLPSDYRQFLPGYAVTSYGAQGKTADHVLFSDSAVKAATDAKQWYVTISRGRKGIRIYTPNKEELQSHVCELDNEILALDLRARNNMQELTQEQLYAAAAKIPSYKKLVPKALIGKSQIKL